MKTLTQQHIKKYPAKMDRFTNVRIWSKQWHAWWKFGGSGYTDDINNAGVFDIKDAWKRTSHCGPEKGIIYEQAV